jgi:hypothetical protein
MYENSVDDPRENASVAAWQSVLSERCFGRCPKMWGVDRADRQFARDESEERSSVLGQGHLT